MKNMLFALVVFAAPGLSMATTPQLDYRQSLHDLQTILTHADFLKKVHPLAPIRQIQRYGNRFDITVGMCTYPVTVTHLTPPSAGSRDVAPIRIHVGAEICLPPA